MQIQTDGKKYKINREKNKSENDKDGNNKDSNQISEKKQGIIIGNLMVATLQKIVKKLRIKKPIDKFLLTEHKLLKNSEIWKKR